MPEQAQSAPLSADEVAAALAQVQRILAMIRGLREQVESAG